MDRWLLKKSNKSLEVPSTSASPFFLRKEAALQGQKTVVHVQATLPTKALAASYEVAHLVAQNPHTIAEWKDCMDYNAWWKDCKCTKAKVLSITSHVKFTHCIIHREALASKTLEPELNNVLQTAIKMVNFIKSRPLNTRLFTLLCQEMGSTHESLLFHSEVR